MNLSQPFVIRPIGTVLLNVDGHKAKLEVISASALNPLRLREMQSFRCPEGL